MSGPGDHGFMTPHGFVYSQHWVDLLVGDPYCQNVWTCDRCRAIVHKNPQDIFNEFSVMEDCDEQIVQLIMES